MSRRCIISIKNKSKLPKVNEEITSPEVRVRDKNGDMIGIVPIKEALALAKEHKLDLVEISADAKPPLCKIISFSQYCYQLKRSVNKQKKTAKVINIKEIKIRPSIEKHDYDVKLNSIKKFITKNDRVKVTLRFKGRELAHQELGVNLMNKIIEDTEEYAKVDSPLKNEGRQLVMILIPK